MCVCVKLYWIATQMKISLVYIAKEGRYSNITLIYRFFGTAVLCDTVHCLVKKSDSLSSHET